MTDTGTADARAADASIEDEPEKAADAETLSQELPATWPEWRWTDALILGPIIAKGIYYYAGLWITPALLGTKPLLASFLRASLPAMIVSGAAARTGHFPVLLALLAPIPYLMICDPSVYWAGRRYGRSVWTYLGRNDKRWQRRIARGERIYSRFSKLAVFFASPLWLPNEVFYFLAGETRMSFPLFLALDFGGTLVWVAELVALGYFIGQPAVDIANTISHYSVPVIIALVVVAFAGAMWRTYRQMAEERRAAA